MCLLHRQTLHRYPFRSHRLRPRLRSRPLARHLTRALLQFIRHESRDKKYTARYASLLLALSLLVINIETALSQENSYDALGIHKGSFFYFPVLDVGVAYDDNVFRLPDSGILAKSDETVVETKQSDTAVTAGASVTMNSDWNRHALNGMASVKLAGYNTFDSEDFTNYFVGLDGKLDVKRGSFATGRVGYRDAKEDRSSVSSRERLADGTTIFGAEPTRYQNQYVGAAYEYHPARLQLRASVDYQTLVYEDISNVFGGDINNGDRDRSRPSASVRVGYEIMPQRSVFVEGRVNQVEYDQPLDDNGIERSSSGYETRLGLNSNLSDLLTGDVYIGYLEQNYDSPELEGISSNTAGMGLRWFPSQLTSVDLGVNRRVEESTEATVSGYLSTIYGVGITHELKRNIILGANADYIDNDFTQNVPGRKENENTIIFGLDATYLLSSRYNVSASYRHTERRSDIANQEYTGNRALIKFVANW